MNKCTFNTHIIYDIYTHTLEHSSHGLANSSMARGPQLSHLLVTIISKFKCSINSWDFNRRRMDGLCHRFTQCMFFLVIPKQIEAC